MRARARRRLVIALVSIAIHVPTTAARAAGAPPACREGMARYRIVTRMGTLTSTVNGRCTFDRAAVESTCENVRTDIAGRRIRNVSVTRHASVADVVDEVSVVPPRNLSLGTTTTTTTSDAGSVAVGTSTHQYDATRRIVSTTSEYEARPSAQRTVVTFTSWDRAGRPTASTQTASGRTTAQSFAYDDATRTQTNRTNGVACTQTFDVNGNPVLGLCGGSTATTTVLTTHRICR